MSLRIDISRLAENAEALYKTVGEYFCVVKCDAYGHGAVKCAVALRDSGRSSFAVFSLSEALEIKRAVTDAEILILGRTDAKYADLISENGFIQTVFSAEYARELSTVARHLRVHIKLDTGMHRSGFTEDPEEIKKAFSGFKGSIEGVYTHFSSADAPSISIARTQLDDFTLRANELEALLSKKLVKHSAASASALRMKSARLDISRIGIALYGYLPDNCEGLCEVRPVMSLCAPIVSLKAVKKGETVGYGCDRTLIRDTLVATVPVGYGFGIPRCAESLFRPCLEGKRVGFVGRICMDRCMLDVTEVPSVRVGDTVELIGDTVTAAELACAEGSIPYETLTRVGRMNKNERT